MSDVVSLAEKRGWTAETPPIGTVAFKGNGALEALLDMGFSENEAVAHLNALWERGFRIALQNEATE